MCKAVQYNHNEVKFIHFRCPITVPPFGLPKAPGVESGISPQGGATVAYRTDGNVTLAAVAYCNPKDNFSYELGRVKASGRLISLHSKRHEADDDKYFRYEGADRAGFLRRLHDFMCADLGYIHRGKKRKTAA